MTVNDMYSLIGQSIIDSIDDNWDRALLKIKHNGKSGGFNLNYWKLDKKKSIRLQNSYQLYKAIKELHQITTEGGHNKWNRLEYRLTPDGEMDLEFIWDQALFDEIERLSNE